MKVEVTEKALKSDGYNLVEGDTLTVPDEVGARWCGYGWAKDVDGKVETGERKPGAQRLSVDNMKVTAKRRVK